MRFIFAGTSVFSASLLEALLEAQRFPVAVLCQPDKKKGRGQKTVFPEIKQLGLAHNLPILQPETLKAETIQAELQALQADLMIVVAYGLRLPTKVLTIPKWGCLNVHASLLPRWRGASPIQQAILAGDQQTGITLMKMDIGLDTGDILAQAPINLEAEETTTTLTEKLSSLAGPFLNHYLDQLEKATQPTLFGMPQNPTQVTHAPKITKQAAAIDWNQPASFIARQIRAFQPWPICYSYIDSHLVRFWSANESFLSNHSRNLPPGTILQTSSEGLHIAAGMNTILQAKIIQLSGRKPLAIKMILNGHAALFQIGQQFVMQAENL